MRFTRPRDQHETPRTSADRTRPDRVRTDLTCDTGGCHGTGACLHTGTCHHTGGCHQTSAMIRRCPSPTGMSPADRCSPVDQYWGPGWGLEPSP